MPTDIDMMLEYELRFAIQHRDCLRKHMGSSLSEEAAVQNANNQVVVLKVLRDISSRLDQMEQVQTVKSQNLLHKFTRRFSRLFKRS